jgi:hypothetical protein
MPNLTKINQWKKEIEIITSDVTDTIESQFVFKRLGEIVKANPKINTDNLFGIILKLTLVHP